MLIISLAVTGSAFRLLPSRYIASTTAYPFIPYNLLHYMFSGQINKLISIQPKNGQRITQSQISVDSGLESQRYHYVYLLLRVVDIILSHFYTIVVKDLFKLHLRFQMKFVV